MTNIHEEALKEIKRLFCFGNDTECAFYLNKLGKCNNCALNTAKEALEKQIVNEADGCTGCTFASCEEWEMPCRKCKRNSKDYWRAKK